MWTSTNPSRPRGLSSKLDLPAVCPPATPRQLLYNESAMTSDNTQRARFASRLAVLPQRPGVYIMRNAKGDVVYVGKAASLRNRVRNYFGAPHSLEPKTLALVQQIDDFEYIVTQNAAEALHLEATLVKRHQPFFN